MLDPFQFDMLSITGICSVTMEKYTISINPSFCQNLVSSNWHLQVSSCIITSFAWCTQCGDIYGLSQQHLCYTPRRGSSYPVPPDTKSEDVYAFSGHVPHFSSLQLIYIGCSSLTMYVALWDMVTLYDSVFVSDTSLTVAFAYPLIYFTDL